MGVRGLLRSFYWRSRIQRPPGGLLSARYTLFNSEQDACPGDDSGYAWVVDVARNIHCVKCNEQSIRIILILAIKQQGDR